MNRNIFSIGILFIIITMVCNNGYSQTCVIGKVINGIIYVGAESRVAQQAINIKTNKIDTTLLSICKIHHIGKFNFVIVGGFSNLSIRMGIKACNGNSSFDNLINAYNKSYGQIIADSLIIYKKYFRSAFESMFNKKIISEIYFFGFENGSPFIKRLLYHINSYSDNNVQVGYELSDNTDYFAGGHYEEIRNLVLNESTWRNNPVAVINKLITIEAKANNIEVGGYIDIIRVSSKKTTWIQKKNSCPISN